MINLEVMKSWIGCECGSGQASTVKKENKQVFTGVRAAAKKCGCSPCHLSMILNKKRTPGATLARRMRKLGIAV